MNNPIMVTKGGDTAALPGFQEGGPGRPLAGSFPQSKKLLSQDILVGTLLFAVSFSFYCLLGLRLADGRYLDYYNLAFDFDPYLYLSTLALDPANRVGVKHPLMIAARPISQLLLVFGMSPQGAAVVTMCVFGALANVVVWVFLRCQSQDRTVALLMTVLFGMTSTTVITAIVPESYGISNFAVALTWLVALLCIRAQSRTALSRWRYVSALVLAGTTITNVVQFCFAEFFVQWERLGHREAWKATVRTVGKFALLFTLAASLVWYPELIEAAKDPLTAIKQILWLKTKGEKTGLLEIFQTFFVYSFVAPDFTTVTLLHDATGKVFTRMWDFREWRFAGHGALAAWTWLGGLVIGTICIFRDRTYAKLYLGMGAAILFNVLFHTDFQFRGSLYLYASHMHFLVFAFFARTASLGAGGTRQRAAYLLALSALIVLVAANNLPLVATFVDGFAQPVTTCRAPCA